MTISRVSVGIEILVELDEIFIQIVGRAPLGIFADGRLHGDVSLP